MHPSRDEGEYEITTLKGMDLRAKTRSIKRVYTGFDVAFTFFICMAMATRLVTADDRTGPKPVSTSEQLPPAPEMPVAGRPHQADAIQELKHAAKDDWSVEVFNEQAGKQLKALGKLLHHPQEISIAALGSLTAEDVRCNDLRPASLKLIYEDEHLTVNHWKAEGQGHEFNSAVGIEHLRGALAALGSPFGQSPSIRTKFKIVHVEQTANQIVSEIYYEAVATGPNAPIQQKGTWTCTWIPQGEDQYPKISSIICLEFTEVAGTDKQGILFDDCTQSVLGSNATFDLQTVRSLDYWRARTDVALGIGFSGFDGLAVGDINGDGLDDVFVTQPGGLPNQMFVQSADGTATDLARQFGLDYLDLTRSALIVDLDNDGDQDLLVEAYHHVYVMLQDESGHFATTWSHRSFYSMSLAAADYDNDSDVDFYLCSYLDPSKASSSPVPYHDANNGRPNFLFRNEGAGKFVEVTKEVGMDVNNRRFSFAASWEDYDNDGDVDLYVANDFGRNNLYRNDDGFFVDMAAQAGVEDISSGMSVAWGDYNNDGWMDLYVSNMFSSAGNRITFQRRFKGDADDLVRSQFQRFARGNSLFENNGDGTFTDVSVAAGVTMGRWAWGSKFVDFNNDGLEDVVVSNGYITNDDTKDL